MHSAQDDGQSRIHSRPSNRAVARQTLQIDWALLEDESPVYIRLTSDAQHILE
jgi:hypothetical protein